ncbi:hypothetical protein DRE_01905 [Drechslerella stenobrocha 248]|uniref:Mid2 domain-containing protein n=1 Tax=Drechslerella stenobrocha 248 TaxID=1043628 RepID=W7I8Q0_9PEZI|nr:hypothetical protein DRE_01905 [Drechslerella stenobrocha 248]
MVRPNFQRTVASVLLFCAAVQAVPALRLRQDADATASDLSTATDLPISSDPSPPPLPTESTGADEPTTSGADEPTTTGVSITDSPSSTSTDDSEPASVTSSVRSSTTGPPAAWISVNETDGRISTIVPSVTTSDGVTSTINLPSSGATGVTEDNGEPASFLPTCDSTKYQGEGKYSPFCLPANNTHLYLKETYYVTWDPTFWADNIGNNTVEILANYIADPSRPESGRVAFDSGVVPNKLGFITFYVDPEKYTNGAIIHWTMKRIGNLANTEKSFRSGPWVQIGNEPVQHPMPSERPPVSTLGLAVGIPLAVLFILVVLAVLHFANRSKRSVGTIVIPSMRRRRAEGGYGSRRSKSQRVSRPPGYQDDLDSKAAAWEMGAMKSPETPRAQGPYQDEPTSPPGVRAKTSETLQNPFNDRYEAR